MEYHEVTLDGHRTFQIQSKSIRVQGSSLFGPTFDLTIKLNQLDESVSTVIQRNKLFWWGVSGVPIFLATCYGLIESTEWELFDFWPGLCFSFIFISLFVAWITRRKIEYAQFNNKNGVPVLTIGRAGPDESKFEPFVQRVQQTAGNGV